MLNHTPERTCVVCREKKNKNELFRIAKINESNYSFDEKQKLQARAIYVCKTHECIKRISKNKKYSLKIEDLLTMVNLLKKQSKDYLNILKEMCIRDRCNLFPSNNIPSNSSANDLKFSNSFPINFGAISFSITGIKSLARNNGSLPPAPEYCTAAQSPNAT